MPTSTHISKKRSCSDCDCYTFILLQCTVVLGIDFKIKYKSSGSPPSGVLETGTIEIKEMWTQRKDKTRGL